jgi:hypothetical protein
MKEWHYSVAIRAWPLSLSPEGEVCVLGFAVFSTPSADVGGGGQAPLMGTGSLYFIYVYHND